MPPTVQGCGMVQDPSHEYQRTCFQFVDHLIQYVGNYRNSSHSPLVRLDGSHSFSTFGREFMRFVDSERLSEIAQEIANAIAESRDIPRNGRPIPILQFLVDHIPLLQRGTNEDCYLFLAYLCKLCLKLEDEGLASFAHTAAEFGKFLIGRHPNCLRHFLWMRNEA